MELPLFNPHSCTDTKQKRRIASGYIEVHGVREHACHLSDHKIIKARAYVVLKKLTKRISEKLPREKI